MKNSRKILDFKKRAFTLIELLVVVSIIVLMSVIAIPNFMRYGRNEEYAQKVEEVKGLVDLTKVSAQNPDKDAVKYQAVYDGTAKSITLNKIGVAGSPTTVIEIKKVVVSNTTTISNLTTKAAYVCDVPGTVCCLYADSTVTTACAVGSSSLASGDWLKLTMGTVNKTISILDFTAYVK